MAEKKVSAVRAAIRAIRERAMRAIDFYSQFSAMFSKYSTLVVVVVQYE